MSVNDIMERFNLPRFDVVKIDIEGGEAEVFQPEADLSWYAVCANTALIFMSCFTGWT